MKVERGAGEQPVRPLRRRPEPSDEHVGVPGILPEHRTRVNHEYCKPLSMKWNVNNSFKNFQRHANGGKVQGDG